MMHSTQPSLRIPVWWWVMTLYNLMIGMQMHLENIPDHDQSETNAENDPARKWRCVIKPRKRKFCPFFFYFSLFLGEVGR